VTGAAAVMVVNPAADGGRLGRRWERLRWEAERIGLDVEPLVTTEPGEATELTRRAIAAGARLVVAVGGDGTVSDVANGFFDGDRAIAPDAELAVVPRGSGCDFIRTFGIPRRTAAAMEVAARGAVRTIDTGRVSFTGAAGEAGHRHFVNVASAGLTGTAAALVNRGGKPLGATVAYAWGALRTFAGYRNCRVSVDVDGERLDLVSNNVIVANCRYFASGMRILPEAEPDDGLFDVLVWGDVSRGDLVRNLHRLYRGTHVNHPKARIIRGRRVTVEPERELPVETDGETPGVTPATFEIVPRALRLRVPR
jgi:YegS/Rv2252/BmrU family lipid kinase